ncbi:MAG: APC family permease [Bacteroidota bacterium]
MELFLTKKFFVFLVINIGLLSAFAYLLTRKDLLSYFSKGKWWLTWLSVAIITLMDELTSIFYAPSEAFRVIGTNAIAFLIITSVFIRIISSRMVEIAEILEFRGIKGGGVYSFSYLVLGPSVSFIAVASILVTYVLTASLSTVSAVENGMSFIDITNWEKFLLEAGIVWFVAGLNIIGIKENAKFTFMIFLIASVVLVNLLSAGMMQLQPHSWVTIGESFSNVAIGMDYGNFFNSFFFIVIGISSCILAYSGIESVVQTASLVKSWKDISKAYTFLAITTGVFTPVIAAVILSSDINILKHETDLVTQFATMVGGIPLGYIVGILASILLMMAVNTAYIASSELMERVAHRYGFHWIIKTNNRQSLYRIHIANGLFYTCIIYLTGGSQNMLAQMYALGLIASFSINIGCLLIYRYSMGTKDSREYNTSRTGTLLVFLVLISCFAYLGYTKPYGTLMWSSVTAVFLLIGLRVAQTRAPEIKQIAQTDQPLNMIFYLVESEAENLHIYFRRPNENAPKVEDTSSAFVSLYHPRQGIPEKVAENHFRFANQSQSVYQGMTEILYALDYELPHKKITIHLGWPTSSWIDRLSIGVMMMSVMRLPKLFPRFNFVIEYFGRSKERK